MSVQMLLFLRGFALCPRLVCNGGFVGASEWTVQRYCGTLGRGSWLKAAPLDVVNCNRSNAHDSQIFEEQATPTGFEQIVSHMNPVNATHLPADGVLNCSNGALFSFTTPFECNMLHTQIMIVGNTRTSYHFRYSMHTIS